MEDRKPGPKRKVLALCKLSVRFPKCHYLRTGVDCVFTSSSPSPTPVFSSHHEPEGGVESVTLLVTQQLYRYFKAQYQVSLVLSTFLVDFQT